MNDTPAPPKSGTLKDEALWKTGRNVVNFQRIETALKSLILFGELDGNPSTLPQRIARAKTKLNHRPLGRLVDDVVDTLYKPQEEDLPPDVRNELWITARLKLKGEKAAEKSHKRELKKLVNSRNELIHKRLTRFNPEMEEDCTELIRFLDDQNEQLTHQMSRLVGLLNAYRELVKNLASHIQNKTPGQERKADKTGPEAQQPVIQTNVAILPVSPSRRKE